jgi:hypothetical protein
MTAPASNLRAVFRLQAGDSFDQSDVIYISHSLHKFSPLFVKDVEGRDYIIMKITDYFTD